MKTIAKQLKEHSFCSMIHEPRHEKTGILPIWENKEADQLRGY